MYNFLLRHKKHVLSSECTLCLTCANYCPENILKLSGGIDAGLKKKIKYSSLCNLINQIGLKIIGPI